MNNTHNEDERITKLIREALPPVVPSADFKDKLNSKIYRIAKDMAGKSAKPIWLRPRFWLPVAASAVIALTSFLVVASPWVPSGSPIVTAAGILEIKVTDAPPEYDIATIDITFSKVEVHKAGDGEGDGGWVEITIVDGQLDLLLLQAAALEALLATEEITAGKYTQLRIAIDTISVTLNGEGEPPEIVLPSGKLKFNHPFEITAEETTTILLDFDAAESLVTTGAGKLIFKPVVKLTIQ